MSTVQIWDKEDLPSELSLKKFILWNSYSFDSIYISIPELVDKNEKILRSKFLAWNYELSQLTLDNQTLAEALGNLENAQTNLKNFTVENSNSTFPTYSDSQDLLRGSKHLRL